MAQADAGDPVTRIRKDIHLLQERGKHVKKDRDLSSLSFCDAGDRSLILFKQPPFTQGSHRRNRLAVSCFIEKTSLRARRCYRHFCILSVCSPRCKRQVRYGYFISSSARRIISGPSFLRFALTIALYTGYARLARVPPRTPTIIPIAIARS